MGGSNVCDCKSVFVNVCERHDSQVQTFLQRRKQSVIVWGKGLRESWYFYKYWKKPEYFDCIPDYIREISWLTTIQE